MKSFETAFRVFGWALLGTLITGIASAQHHAGEACLSCHPQFSLGGTVFPSVSSGQPLEGVAFALVSGNGARITLPASDSSGRVHASSVPAGEYRMRLGQVRSRSWHRIPEQGDCNTCHVPGGNGSSTKTKSLPQFHTELPAGNDCLPCHFFPASMRYDQLRTAGRLNGAAPPLPVQESRAVIRGQAYPFLPESYSITSLRPDIFNEGSYSLFDVLLAVAERNGIDIRYHWDDSCQTHFIDSVAGVRGDFWHHFSYDAGSGTQSELQFKRQERWDELLYQPGAWIQLVMGENLEELRREFKEEIVRERRYGHMIPQVQIAINPSDFRGNPPGSGRITVSRTFTNVVVRSHNLRASGGDSLYRMPHRPGVVTAMDLLYSLADSNRLTFVGRTYFTRLAGKVMESFRVREIGFPGIGSAHASGSQGFVYTNANGTVQRLANGADGKQHVHADIHVIHAPDFARWRWIELGNPYYEQSEPTGMVEVFADNDAIDKGFRLQQPYPSPAAGSVHVPFNIFEPGRYRIDLIDITGRVVRILHDADEENIGVRSLSFSTADLPAGVFHIRMTNGRSIDIQRVQLVEK